MSIDIHTISNISGAPFLNTDRVHMGVITLPYAAGEGDPSAIAAGSPGAGYASIPTVAFATAGSGSGATAAALMGVVANPTIAAPGSGGTNGAVTLTGTTGTGTKFTLSGTIAGGVLTAITGITLAGSYSALPSSLAAEPVTGGSLTGCTVNLSAAMGVIGYTVAGSSNHLYPQGTTAALTGGTPTTPAIPGAVTVTAVNGEPSVINYVGAIPPGALVIPAPASGVYVDVSNQSATGFTATITPRSGSAALSAGSVGFLVIA